MSAHIEIPAFYVDELILDELGGTYFVVLNRSPEDGATQVQLGADFAFDLATSAGDTPNNTTLQIYLTTDGGTPVLVYDGNAGGFQPGFTGPDSTIAPVDARTKRVVIDPSSDLGSLQVVTLHVLATSTGGQVLDETWSWTMEDLTPPRLESATVRSATVIRLVFDEPLNMEDTTSTASALNPENYAFTPLAVPGVTVEAVSVSMVTTSSVDVTIDIEMSPDVPYRVTVTGVEDLLGNEIVAPYNVADFVGYRCPQPEGRFFELWRMLSQRTRDRDMSGELQLFVLCLQEVTDLLLCMIDDWTKIIDVDTAPESFLDAMLEDLGNPFAFDLTETDKRHLIRLLVAAYGQKGTAPGIINLVRFFLGIEVQIVAFSGEGWDLGEDELGEDTILGPGTSFALYSFEIIAPVALTEEQRARITTIANYMKPAHTHLVRITEPETPEVIDHLELGLSELGPEWILH